MPNIELGDGFIPFRIVFLKLKNMIELRMLTSHLFHFHISFGKKGF